MRPTAGSESPRRIVLLAADGTNEAILATPAAGDVIAELRRLRQGHPGRALAAEWRHHGKWVRWITTTPAKNREGPISTG